MNITISESSTTNEVRKWIEEHESHIWDEYVSVYNIRGKNYIEDVHKRKFYDDAKTTRIAVWCCWGGSEGIYLHIESDKTKDCLIIGKTCNSSNQRWDECWQSAGRIAKVLQI